MKNESTDRLKKKLIAAFAGSLTPKVMNKIVEILEKNALANEAQTNGKQECSFTLKPGITIDFAMPGAFKLTARTVPKNLDSETGECKIEFSTEGPEQPEMDFNGNGNGESAESDEADESDEFDEMDEMEENEE